MHGFRLTSTNTWHNKLYVLNNPLSSFILKITLFFYYYSYGLTAKKSTYYKIILVYLLLNLKVKILFCEPHRFVFNYCNIRHKRVDINYSEYIICYFMRL
jgi:hypothetical protein